MIPGYFGELPSDLIGRRAVGRTVKGYCRIFWNDFTLGRDAGVERGKKIIELRPGRTLGPVEPR